MWKFYREYTGGEQEEQKEQKQVKSKTELKKLEELILCIKDKQRKNSNPMIERSFIEAKIKELAFVDDIETVFQHLYENGAISELDVIENLGGFQD